MGNGNVVTLMNAATTRRQARGGRGHLVGYRGRSRSWVACCERVRDAWEIELEMRRNML